MVSSGNEIGGGGGGGGHGAKSTAGTGVVARLRRVPIREALWNSTMEFCRNTTLHGFRDLADEKVHWMDRWVRLSRRRPTQITG